MDKNPDINQLHEQFCNRLKITENSLKKASLELFLSTDFDNYLSIKFLSKQINSLILATNTALISNNKVLLTIANTMGYKNHHEMKSKIISKMLEESKSIVEDIHVIFRTNGVKGLLPQNLPDHILKICSIEFEAYQDGSKDISISGLFSAISLIMLNEKYSTMEDKNQNINFDMTLEELDSKFCSYGVELSLEGLCRMGIISVSKDTLPDEYSIFNNDRKKEITLNLSHPENLKKLFS